MLTTPTAERKPIAVCADPRPLTLGAGNEPPDWIELIPAGTFTMRTGGPSYRNGDPAGVIARSLARAGGTQIAGDYDHQLENVERNGGQAIASGWVQELAVRDGAIWGRVEWTSKAAEHIRAREYRYISPVFMHDRDRNVIAVLRFGLTNKPLLDLTPLAASEPGTGDNMSELARRLAPLFGLAVDANDDAIVEAATRRTATLAAVCADAGTEVAATAADITSKIRVKGVDLSQYVAASEYSRVTAELNTERAARTEREITEALAEGGRTGKIAPASQDYWRQVCAEAKSAKPLADFLKVAPVVVPPGTQIVTGSPPASDGGLTDEDKKVCAQLGLTEEQFKKARGV